MKNGTELRNFCHFEILTWVEYSDLSRNLENWLILKFVFIHFKAVKVSQKDQIRMWTWFTSVFLMNRTELRSFSHFQILTKIAYLDLKGKSSDWLILKFVFIHYKAVKVRQMDQTQM